MSASTHKAEVVRIREVEPHPNADALGVVRVFGYTCCVRLGDFKPGDLAVYVVPDSLVPDTPTFAFLGGNRRIKVRRLRGVYSQGLLIPAPPGLGEGDDAAGILGIARYEPPCSFNTGGEAERGPPIPVPSYEIESWHRYSHLLVPGEVVAVTEKIHGAFARFAWHGGRLYCGSKAEWKRESDKNLWWAAAREHPWIAEFCGANPGHVLCGEVFGRVQDLRYGVDKGGKPKFVAFDAFDSMALAWWSWDKFVGALDRRFRVPALWVGPYDAGQVVALSRGASAVEGASNVREGAVVAPVVDRVDVEVGRVKLKLVSDEYLSR